jgi:type I restriction enzyme R subunit
MNAPSPENSEWLTRKQLIDNKLKAAGWAVVPFTSGKAITAYERCAVEELQTANGPADYALCLGGQVVAVVEAKKLTLGPQNVLSQAERYSKGVNQPAVAAGEFGVPFLYSTNGEVIWHHDVRHQLNRSRRIEAFHTPEALKEQLQRDFEAATERVLAMPNSSPRLRPYQGEANEAIERALAKRNRKMLIAMATGTGKTFTMVNEIYRLMKSGVARRILFLVDRRALAAQAVRAFTSFEAEAGLKFDKVYDVFSQRFQREDFGEEEKFDPKVLPSSYLLAPKVGNAFVYISTIQRMTINLFGREAIWGSGDDEIDDDAEKLALPCLAPFQRFDGALQRHYLAGQQVLAHEVLVRFATCGLVQVDHRDRNLGPTQEAARPQPPLPGDEAAFGRDDHGVE